MNAQELKEAAVAYGEAEYQSPYAALADELYRERVLRARRTPPEEKFLAGEELFEYACAITLAGIRNQNPGFSEEDCRRELNRRLDWREKMEREE
jgi:hypothetical protein